MSTNNMKLKAYEVFAVALAVFIAAATQAIGWAYLHESALPPDVKLVKSLSFAPYTRQENPLEGVTVTPERIAADIALVAPVSGGVRTYAVTGGLELVPEEAVKRKGFRVTIGAWLDKDPERNAKELETAIHLANTNKSVVAVSVGNETILREDLTPEDLIAKVREVRGKVKRNTKVTTSETWDIWLKHPELAESVDYISAHILPYWEGIEPEVAVSYAFARYDDLKARFPDKDIVIAEFGWPSRGYNQRGAVTGPVVQASVIREFIAEATKRGVDYNLVEAFDQPWKVSEGLAGAYWGLFDADRMPKFNLYGLVEMPDTKIKAAAAAGLGTLLTMFGLYRRRPTVGHALGYALAAHGMAAGLVSAAWWPFEFYMTPGTAFMWGVGLLALIPLAVITLGKVHEVAEVLLGRRPTRLYKPTGKVPGPDSPFVSIHIPAYKEPPALLIETLDAVAALDYPNFEALVIVNNTPEEEYWKPIEAHCQKLGPRFKFVFLPKVAGFKAGALNMAMAQMDPRTKILALLDADYVVAPNWLRDLTPAFEDEKIALVQAPQDHRDGNRSALHRMMNWEYAGFFDIGMIQRNEFDAIIAHGTMLMIRLSAFEAVGGWCTDTIVEDSELGLRLYEAGWSAHYTNTRYGWGVLPNDFRAYKTQRHRWAYGAVQIIRKHWRHMLPGVKTLRSAQKVQYATGWFFWLSDALGVLIAGLNLMWVPFVLIFDIMVPTVAMTIPVLTAFVVNTMHCLLLYRARVKATPGETLAAAIAAMSLQVTVAKAVFDGFVRDGLPFMRTEKGGGAKAKKSERPVALWETLLGTALTIAAAALYVTNINRITEYDLFATTLLIQAIPPLSATAVRLVEKWGRRTDQPRPAPVGSGPVAIN